MYRLLPALMIFSVFKINKPVNGVQYIAEIFPWGQIDIAAEKFCFFMFEPAIENIIEVMTADMYPDIFHMIADIFRGEKVAADGLTEPMAAFHVRQVFLPFLKEDFVKCIRRRDDIQLCHDLGIHEIVLKGVIF